MASSSSSYLFLLVITVTFLSFSVISARPCKTFLISSYSLSITPQENPNLDSDLSSTRFFTVRRLSPHHIVPLFVNRRHGFLPSAVENPQIRSQLGPSFPFVSENIDRFRYIFSIVVALLFSVGCGALTAATMYLVLALVVNRRSYNLEEEENDYENDESDDASLKKIGYVKNPSFSS